MLRSRGAERRDRARASAAARAPRTPTPTTRAPRPSESCCGSRRATRVSTPASRRSKSRHAEIFASSSARRLPSSDELVAARPGSSSTSVSVTKRVERDRDRADGRHVQARVGLAPILDEREVRARARARRRPCGACSEVVIALEPIDGCRDRELRIAPAIAELPLAPCDSKNTCASSTSARRRASRAARAS